MKKKFPVHSYPWYVQDWHNSMSRLSMDLETRGFYRELLDYTITEGPFPADLNILGAIARCTVDDAARLWPKVQHKFVEKNEQWSNRKAAEVRGLIQERKGKISDSRKHRGIKETSPRCLSDDSEMSTRTHRESEGDGEGEGDGEVSSDTERLEVSPRRTRQRGLDALNPQQRGWFVEVFWPPFWRKDAKIAAAEAFGKIKTDNQLASLMAGVERDMARMMARDVDKRPQGSTYINQNRAEDEPSPAPNTHEGLSASSLAALNLRD